MNTKTHHTTKDGVKIAIKDLETDHLINIIKWIEKMADKGFTITSGGGCSYDIDTLWFDEDTYKGESAKQYLGYDSYVEELDKRDRNKMWNELETLGERINYLESRLKQIS